MYLDRQVLGSIGPVSRALPVRMASAGRALKFAAEDEYSEDSTLQQSYRYDPV